ncbi:MAG: hypothetical protein CVV60_01265 [Tenericutes bacterium HGW-Tenericutes-5]|jgi:hypothetical protein|nr:MAG: hypothetical protein CVV60_01265 [Tenericutes bacterium HGW-Tenericutes-5]
MNLFREYDLSVIIDKQNKAIIDYVSKYSDDEIMANDEEILIDNAYNELVINEVSIEEEDFSLRKVVQKKLRQRVDPMWKGIGGREFVDVDGFSLTFYFPYSGDKDLFFCRASTYSLSGYPNANITDKYVIVNYELPLNQMRTEQDKEQLMKRVLSDIASIKSGINYANNDVKLFNKSLRAYISTELMKRKANISQFSNLAKMFEVKVVKSPELENRIITKKRISPISHTYNAEDSYYISDEEYRDILFTIKHNCTTYERTPQTFQHLHEEDLRNLLLASLNGMYLGNANGEAFRGKGKTDISIEKENRAAFVAECKIWSGAGKIEEDLLQLDSYLTWRDCKTALIYFVRNKDFLSVIENIGIKLNEIPFVRRVTSTNGNEYKCQYVSANNPGQIVQLRVQLYNLYSI